MTFQSFQEFLKSSWGDIALDSSITLLVLHQFQLTTLQCLTVMLVFIRIQYRLLSKLIEIEVPASFTNDRIMKMHYMLFNVKEYQEQILKKLNEK